MATREANFWGRIVNDLWAPDRVLMRVENGVADGVPDSYYTIDGVSGWMELKCPIEPARQSTPLFGGGNHKLSIAQRNWLLAHRQARGVGWIAVESDHNVLLIGSRHADSVNLLSLSDLRALADFRALRPMKKSDWMLFWKTLTLRHASSSRVLGDLP
jgi:hypothetical protein